MHSNAFIRFEGRLESYLCSKCDAILPRSYLYDLMKLTCDVFINFQHLGPSFTHADFCPMVVSDAQDCNKASDSKTFPALEVFSDSSKCMDVTVGGTKSAVCLKSGCNPDLQTFDFEVGNKIYSCSKDHEILTADISSTQYQIHCPRLAQVCPK